MAQERVPAFRVPILWRLSPARACEVAAARLRSSSGLGGEGASRPKILEALNGSASRGRPDVGAHSDEVDHQPRLFGLGLAERAPGVFERARGADRYRGIRASLVPASSTSVITRRR